MLQIASCCCSIREMTFKEKEKKYFFIVPSPFVFVVQLQSEISKFRLRSEIKNLFLKLFCECRGRIFEVTLTHLTPSHLWKKPQSKPIHDHNWTTQRRTSTLPVSLLRRFSPLAKLDLFWFSISCPTIIAMLHLICAYFRNVNKKKTVVINGALIYLIN